ncbi:MAG TPA: GIDE domain-containing protein [Candidatus Acidoferrales bacterium]|nr:GIDE domain-containing protein [Candidatus Acidoferrales bacterium]
MFLGLLASAGTLTVSTDTGKLEFWAAVGAVAGVVLFIRGFMMLREKRIIMNTPSSKIRSAAMGLVEVSGMARGPQTIPAGITGEPCYYYRAIAWQLRQNGRNQSWKKVADESLYVPFFVDDSTGRLLVDPQGAELDVHCNFKDEIGSSFFRTNELMPADVNGFLVRNGLILSERTRLEEYCIKPDYPLFVLGTLSQTSGNPEWTAGLHVPSNRTSLASRVSFFGPTGIDAFRSLGLLPGLKIEASTSRGTSAQIAAIAVANRMSTPAAEAPQAKSSWSSISMDDHFGSKLAVVPAPAQAVTSPSAPSQVAIAEPDPRPADAAAPQSSNVNGFDLRPPVFLCKGANHDPFMISSRSQREIVQSMAWKSTLCIWGGPILTLVCLYFLALTLGWT